MCCLIMCYSLLEVRGSCPPATRSRNKIVQKKIWTAKRPLQETCPFIYQKANKFHKDTIPLWESKLCWSKLCWNVRCPPEDRIACALLSILGILSCSDWLLLGGTEKGGFAWGNNGMESGRAAQDGSIKSFLDYRHHLWGTTARKPGTDWYAI